MAPLVHGFYRCAAITLLALLSIVNLTNAACSTSFIAIPSLPGGQILSLTAVAVTNYTSSTAAQGSSPLTINFCNVTVLYTHPGWNDTITVQVWLPLTGWNERLQGVGGGGYAGIQGFDSLSQAVADNYSAVGSDLGHAQNALSSASWSLDASGKVNLALLADFASIGLNDASVLGKAISKSFYGHAPKYSYWSGCSTGGRQGLMLAQRYPQAYDGIVSGAPAINWEKFIVAEYWPQFVMQQENTFPSPCVYSEIVNATVAACDAVDGAVDGIISAPSLCKFDPYSLVGQSATCGNLSTTITATDASIVQKIWAGMTSVDGTFLWWGLEPGAPFSGLAGTVCTSATDCQGSPFEITTDWISYFVQQNPSFDLTNMTWSEYATIFYMSSGAYDLIIGTDNPDLYEFKNAGGKLVHWHGLADQLIFPQGSENYYQRVEARDLSVRDYYRFFEAPGVEHCGGGTGPAPSNPVDAVVAWVERGVAPDVLPAVSSSGTITRNLCPYPLVARYLGGDVNNASSFSCARSF